MTKMAGVPLLVLDKCIDLRLKCTNDRTFQRVAHLVDVLYRLLFCLGKAQKWKFIKQETGKWVHRNNNASENKKYTGFFFC